MRARKAIVMFVVLAMIAAAVAYVTVLTRRGFSAQAEPSAPEKLVAREMRNIAIPGRARNAQNPWKDRFTPELMTYTRHHFADHCAICHANDGSGQGEIGRGLYPKPPDMRLPATQSLSDGELYYIIENGVPLTGMPAWGDQDSTEQDDDSWQLVLFIFIRHLSQLTTNELKDMERYNPTGLFDAEEEQHEESEQHAGGHHHHH
jgi:mono/diheme cytochrome c family protein